MADSFISQYIEDLLKNIRTQVGGRPQPLDASEPFHLCLAAHSPSFIPHDILQWLKLHSYCFELDVAQPVRCSRMSCRLSSLC